MRIVRMQMNRVGRSRRINLLHLVVLNALLSMAHCLESASIFAVKSIQRISLYLMTC